MNIRVCLACCNLHPKFWRSRSSNFCRMPGLTPVTDCAIRRLCIKALAGGSGAQLGQGGYKEMNLMRTNRLPWLLSGALGASLSLAPALVAQQQGGATAQQTPTPGQQGDWGQAGPPPDAQNGQIPAPDAAAQDPNQSADQGPPQYPGQAPNQDQGPPQYPNQAPPAPAGAPGVGYGQPPRPAYQPGQNQPNGYNGYQAPQGVAQARAALRPRYFDQGYAGGDPHQ